MNLMSIIIAAIFILCAISGLRKGMARKLSGVLSLVISALLVSAFLPHVTQLVKTRTSIYSTVEEKCESLISDQIVNSLTGTGSSSGTSDSSGTVNRDQLKELMDQYGLDSSRLDGMPDSQVQEYVENYLKPYLEPFTSGTTDSLNLDLSNGETVLDGMSQTEQTKLIQSLPIPEFLQNLMLTYNNKEGYKALDVSGFGGYLSAFVANIVINIVSFLLTLLIVWIIVRIILACLHLAARLPVIRVADRFGGLLVGLVQGLMITWILFLIISMFSGTSVGAQLIKMIDSSTILQPLYEGNLFMKSVVNSLSNIM